MNRGVLGNLAHRPPRVFYGTSFAVEEIALANSALDGQRVRLAAEAERFDAAFKSHNLVETKLAGEALVQTAAALERTTGQIKVLTGSVVSAITSHMARRPR